MRPTVSTFTERVYAQLPTVYQDNDSALDYPLLRFLSLLGDQAGEVEDIFDRINDDDSDQPDWNADLADPQGADLAWLPWLAQLVGADIHGLTGQAARDAVAYSASGFRAGSKAAVAAAAKSALTGTRYVRVYDHSSTTVGDGGQWDVLLVTRVSETPDVAAVLAVVSAKRAKPAGVVLHHKAYSATYEQVQIGTTPNTYAGRLATFPLYQDAADYLPPGA